MSDSSPSPICCGTPTSWVENIPGKGYNYCRECKKEVAAEPSAQELQRLEGFNRAPNYLKQASAADRINEAYDAALKAIGVPRPVMGIAGERLEPGDAVVADDRGILPPRTGTGLRALESDSERIQIENEVVSSRHSRLISLSKRTSWTADEMIQVLRLLPPDSLFTGFRDVLGDHMMRFKHKSFPSTEPGRKYPNVRYE